jgi:deoxyribonuclease V
MPFPNLQFQPDWDLSPKEAIEEQQSLRDKVVIEPLPLERLTRVAGVDVGFHNGLARAAAVLLSFPELQILQEAVVEIPLQFPYIPGLLSFREAPSILAALGELEQAPDLILCDGQGLAHPRRFGLACHIGVLTGLPALGCAKSILIGVHKPVGEERGSVVNLVDHDEIIGAVVRTRTNVKPVIISIGNRIDLESAVQAVLACGTGYRLPEPTRQADRIASRRG